MRRFGHFGRRDNPLHASARTRAAEVSLRTVWHAEDARRRTLREALMALPLVAMLGVAASATVALEQDRAAPLALAGAVEAWPAGFGFDAGLPAASAVLAARIAGRPDAVQDAPSQATSSEATAGADAHAAPLRPQTPPPLIDMVELPADEPEMLDAAASARAAAERSAERATDARARVER